MKTDSSGKKEWDKTFGGSSWDGAYSVEQTADSGYIIAGETESYGAGSYDFWLIKVKGELTNQPPVASFTYSPEKPVVNQTVTFNASSSYDPDGTIDSYVWNFGDGETGSGEMVSHIYSSLGDYEVNLTVTDDNGATNSIIRKITVEEIFVPEEEWNKTFGGSDDDRAYSVQQTADSGTSSLEEQSRMALVPMICGW